MLARDIESELLDRCAEVALGGSLPAQNHREANVFLLSAKIIGHQFPSQAERLMQAGEKYFTIHPKDRLASADIVRNGWIISGPRLRDMLTFLSRKASPNYVGAQHLEPEASKLCGDIRP